MNTNRSGNLSTWALIILALAVLGGAAWAGGLLQPATWLSQWVGTKSHQPLKNLVTETAQRGPFLVSLSVQGYLDSQRNATLSSQVEGTTTIIRIVPEGSWVTQGEVVCELDSSLLREQAKQQEQRKKSASSDPVPGSPPTAPR